MYVYSQKLPTIVGNCSSPPKVNLGVFIVLGTLTVISKAVDVGSH